MVRPRSLIGLSVLGLLAAGSCGPSTGSGPGKDAGIDGPRSDVSCDGLECQQVSCDGSKKTTLTGRVLDPAGQVALFNVLVYVPNGPLAYIPDGVTCDRCGSMISGRPLTVALTDTKGRFVLENVPVGPDIPFVIQSGKWRRQFTVPSVSACKENALTDVRMPKNQDEGNLPRIALSTGGRDALECLLRKVGIDDIEFTAPEGPGRVNLYAGELGTDKYARTLNGGAPLPASSTLWGDVETLKRYDVVLLSCEGMQYLEKKPEAARKAMFDYASAGGRVFASHWHNIWLEQGPDPFPSVATWNHQNDLGDITANVDTTFPKGLALAEWLVNVGAGAKVGSVALKDTQHTVDAVADFAYRWIYSDAPTSSQYLSFNTPIGVAPEMQCGRVVFSDIHVSSGTGDASGPTKPFPSGCVTTGLTPQEKVLEFMLFDLTSCIQDDKEPPVAPPIL